MCNLRHPNLLNMNFFHLTYTDLIIAIVITSGLLAGLFAYLMLPSLKKERQNCIISMLFGIIFSLASITAVHVFFPNIVNGVPTELSTLFLWCLSFLPSLVLSLIYGVFVRKQSHLEY